MKAPRPSQEQLALLLRYEPETGKLYWRKRPRDMFKTQRSWSTWNARYAGKPALACRNQGYAEGCLLGGRAAAHRVIWALVHGRWPTQVDHINGVRDDNRLRNLREVEPVENSRNRRGIANASGAMGVRRLQHSVNWQARITVDRKPVHLGTFPTFEEAVSARLRAQYEYGFHPNHGRRK